MRKLKLFNNKLCFVTLLLAIFIIGCHSDKHKNKYYWPTDTTAPTVSYTDPAANLTPNVAVNKQIAVIFSEAMDPLTLTTATFRVINGMIPIAGTVSYAGGTAIFTPSSNLAANTIYTAMVTTGVKDIAGNPLAVGYTWSFATGAASDTTAPTVNFTDPVNLATNVSVNKKIVATFSEAMAPLTITTATFMVMNGMIPVAGIVSYDGVTAIFRPSSNLAANTIYTATVTTGAKDLAGNPLAVGYTWSFTVGAAPDTTAPTVSSTNPVNNATDVAINRKISATFSEVMVSSTLTPVTFTVKDGLTPVDGTVSYAGVTATFTPSSNLATSIIYTATVTTGVKDLAGNPLAADYTWSFTTGVTSDTTAPMVSSTDPVNSDTGIAINKKITATFSEAMDPLTIIPATFTVTDGITPVAGIVTYVGVTATFTPSSDLTSNTIYTATITTGAKDLAGNPLAADYSWSFTTGAAPDTTAPMVSSTDPDNLATNVDVNKKIAATFSEAMDPLTLTPVTFTVTDDITPVAGTITYAGVTATFTPSNDLTVNTIYTCKITGGLSGAKDLAGNSLAVDKDWSFTTGTILDIIAPTVTSVSPADGEINVAINRKITATFSEAMDPLTLTTATFTVINGITPVLGIVTYAGQTATFTPSSNLATLVLYDCKIKGGLSGAKDLAGNPLAIDKDWQFTTGSKIYPKPPLGTAALFGNCGGSAGMTNQGILTLVHGNIATTAVSTNVTGFHDTGGNIYTETPLNFGTVNGTVYTATAPPGSVPGVIAAQCLLDMQTTFNYLVALPFDVLAAANQIGGLSLAPGVYKAPGAGNFIITLNDLTLNAGGDPDAVWVFQMSSSLTVGEPGFPRQIILTGGAQAKNVYWQVSSAARIEDRCNMVGTIIAYSGVTISTSGELGLTTLNGRALSLNASVTVVNTVITVPGI